MRGVRSTNRNYLLRSYKLRLDLLSGKGKLTVASGPVNRASKVEAGCDLIKEE